MKITNYYDRIRSCLKRLNSLHDGLFVLRMDGSLIQLHDCSRNKILLIKQCTDIDSFCNRLYHITNSICLHHDFINSDDDKYRSTLLNNSMNKRYVKLYRQIYDYE